MCHPARDVPDTADYISQRPSQALMEVPNDPRLLYGFPLPLLRTSQEVIERSRFGDLLNIAPDRDRA